MRMAEFRQGARAPENVHCVSKNVPALLCCNFDIYEHILIFFARNVTQKVSNEKHFTRPPQITCASSRAFQRAINQGSTPPLTSSKWG